MKDNKHRHRARLAAIVFLGSKCVRCQFIDIRALQIDHVNGGGNQEKKRIGDYAMYKRVIECPNDYQLLCANCNWIKRYEENEK